MNKFLLFVIAAVMPLALYANEDKPCEAPNSDPALDIYTGFRISATNMRLSMDNWENSTNTYPTGIGLNIGYRFNEYTRMELEVDYTDAENRPGTARLISNSQMINIYWSSTAARREPSLYAGFGMGTSNLDMNWGTGGWGEGAFKFSYQFVVGLDLYLNRYLGVDLGIRYRHFGDVMHQIGATRHYTDIYAFQLYAGMKYKW